MNEDLELLQNMVDELNAINKEREKPQEMPEQPKKQTPTHEQLRAEGVDLPDWVPVEDILVDKVALEMQDFAFWRIISAYRNRKEEAKHASINS